MDEEKNNRTEPVRTPVTTGTETVLTESGLEEPHPVQKFMDNIWLLLLLGLAIPFVSYTLWGLIELLNIPQGTLP